MADATLAKRPEPRLMAYAKRLVGSLSTHPISSRGVGRALLRVATYQVAVRLRREVVWPWIAGSKLALTRGQRGASGNIYSGLGEYQEMGFFLHLLRPGDLFFDLGANIGSFTVLASKVCGARTVAVEPDPDTLNQLRRNVAVNGIDHLVSVKPFALSDHNGEVEFWVGWDTSNRIATPGDGRATRTLPCRRLDDLVSEPPFAIKMDLEGGEDGAMRGATRILSSPELQAIAIEQAGPDFKALLQQQGFRRVYYDPATRELSEQPNGLKVADEIYVRDIGFCRARLTSAPHRTICGQRI